ncbi:MAG: electron transfer flavoprotein subunit beta/FixA family protein [Candidatus Zixiibacteriota bacterium]|nr:MAG: electron transfer flavoprotein subunit beta/FixA family protein [candidate division Zixibacteria bacterium]
MKVAVLVKQTPQLSEVTMGGEGPKWPEGTDVVNPFDEYAVEEAIRIKENHGAGTIAITYGGTDAVSALRDVLALGIDEAVHIEADSYSATDPQNISRVLAACIKKLGDIDLVLTGKQACDDDSAMVAFAVAAHLDWPQIGFVKKFDKIEDSGISAWRTTDTGYDIVEVPLPAVCSVVKEINEPRLPSLKGKMKAKKAEIQKLSLADLGIEHDKTIEIMNIQSPPQRSQGEILEGEPDEVVGKLIGKLKADQLI